MGASTTSSAIIVFGALLATGCNHHVFSPPARALPLESVAPVGKGRVGVGLEGALHGAVFGPSASSGSGRVRVSPHEDVDVAVEGHVIHIDGEPAANIDQNAYAVRVGAKFRAVSWFALTGGFGGGLHAGGTFASPDLGFIGGWENRYAVPYLSLRGFVSEPLIAREVDTSFEGDPLGTDVGTPQTTGGLSFALGLRVPMIPGWDPHEGVRGSLFFSHGLTHMADRDDELTLFQLAAGAELTF